MDYQGTIYALLRAVGFKVSNLTKRLLQEKGASEIDTYTIYRYALIPAIVWALIFVRKKDIDFILGSPRLIFLLVAIIVLFNLWAFLKSYVINITSSMVLLTTLYHALTLPLYLLFGTIFNNDIPNTFNIVAISVLLVALLINPAHHKKNVRPRLSRPFAVVALLIVANALCATVLDGASREMLKEINPAVFLGIFGVTTLSVCAVISKFFINPRVKETKIMKEKKWLALLVPMLWFASSIPEVYAFAALPIYTVISIGTITFGMDAFSDVIHKRIRLNFQTIAFIGLVLAGLGLTILSV